MLPGARKLMDLNGAGRREGVYVLETSGCVFVRRAKGHPSATCDGCYDAFAVGPEALNKSYYSYSCLSHTTRGGLVDG